MTATSPSHQPDPNPPRRGLHREVGPAARLAPRVPGGAGPGERGSANTRAPPSLGPAPAATAEYRGDSGTRRAVGARERRAGPARRGAGQPPSPPGGLSRHLPAAAAVAAALRKPCPVAGHHGNGTAEFRGRRAARPDPRPRERAHLHRECPRSDTHGAREEHRAVPKRLRRLRDSEPARGPSLSSHPGPGATPGAESVRSPGVLEVARVGKLATARGVAVESRRAAGPSHIHTFNCFMLVQIQWPPAYLPSAQLLSLASNQQRCASLPMVCIQFKA